MILDDSQALPQIIRVYGHAHLALPAQLLQIRERIGSRPPFQIHQQGVPVLRLDSLGRYILREQSRTGCDRRRIRKEVGRSYSLFEGAVAPDNLVQQILHSLDRRQQRRPRRPFHHVPAQPAKQSPGRIVNTQFPAQDLRRQIRFLFRLAGRGLIDAHVAKHPVWQWLRQPQSLPAERQVRRLPLGARHVSRHTHDLKATVQHKRVDIQLVPAQGFRQRHFSQRFTWPGPHLPQRAEEWAEVDSGRCLGTVISRHVSGRQAGLQFFDIDLGAAFRHGSARRYTALNVLHPAFLASPAEYPDTPRRRLFGGIEHNLHLSAILLFPVPRLRVRKDQRVMQLQVFDHHRPAAFGKRGRCRHTAIQGTRCDEQTEYPVVAQPRRIRGEDLGLENDLATGGFMPDAQQGVTFGQEPSLRGLDPVAFALERIARQ